MIIGWSPASLWGGNVSVEGSVEGCGRRRAALRLGTAVLLDDEGGHGDHARNGHHGKDLAETQLARRQLGHQEGARNADRKSTRLNSSHSQISYAVFCLKKKKNTPTHNVQMRRITPRCHMRASHTSI